MATLTWYFWGPWKIILRFLIIVIPCREGQKTTLFRGFKSELSLPGRRFICTGCPAIHLNFDTPLFSGMVWNIRLIFGDWDLPEMLISGEKVNFRGKCKFPENVTSFKMWILGKWFPREISISWKILISEENVSLKKIIFQEMWLPGKCDFGAPEECSPLSKTGQTEDKVNPNGSHSPYISALCLPSDLDRTLASVQLHIALWMTPIYCLSSLYPQFIFGYLEFSFTLTSQFSYFLLTGGEHCWSWYWFPFLTFGAIHIRQAQKFELFFWSF